MLKKPTGNNIVNGENLNASHLRSGTKLSKDVHSHLIDSSYHKGLASACRWEKEIKGIQIAKEEVELCLFADTIRVHCQVCTRMSLGDFFPGVLKRPGNLGLGGRRDVTWEVRNPSAVRYRVNWSTRLRKWGGRQPALMGILKTRAGDVGVVGCLELSCGLPWWSSG